MKKYLLLILLLIASSVHATQRALDATWEYTPPSSPVLSGFSLYKEGYKVCTFTPASARSGSCTVDIIQDKTSFTLTATFLDGTESPHSTPFILIVVPGPTIISIKLQ